MTQNLNWQRQKVITILNYLESLVAEWYEYKGYFVRRNVHVGKLSGGGYECELDVVAFHPDQKHLIHIEPSMDAHSWEKREARYQNGHCQIKS